MALPIPGAGPSPPGARSPFPGSMAAGPPGPGASPVGPAGGGAGNEAMADSVIKAVIEALHKALSAYPIGSKKYTAVVRSISALTANFGKEQKESMVPAAILQMMQAARSGAGPNASPPPPLEAAPMGEGTPNPTLPPTAAG